jgi:beta-glucosidase
MPVFDPATHARRDRAVARAQDWAFVGAMLHALDYGLFLPPLPGPRHVRGVARSFDWLGLNYYGRYRVAFDPKRPAELFGRRSTEGTIKTEHNDWGEPCAEGLSRQLLRLARFRKPLYVTENGVFDDADVRRSSYLVDHVRAVHGAIEAGADVRGYFVWSLVDNFEWAEGWATPFGLFALDRETQARTPRGSAEVYARICRANAVDDAEPEPRTEGTKRAAVTS